jgi:hypothetical protein
MSSKRWPKSKRSFAHLGVLAAALLVAAPAAAEGKPPANTAAAGKNKPGSKKEEAPAPTVAPTTKKPVTIEPKELSWGLDHKKLATIYDRVIENDYKDAYRKAQPGVQMEAIDAEVAEKKAEFRRSYTAFGTIATGWDATPLKPEYSYANQEALMQITRKGKTRTFFFIQGKLWKIVDELAVGEKSAWGKTFDEAVGKLNAYYEVTGRPLAADPAQNRPFREVDYQHGGIQVRAIDWSENQVGLVFQDAATVAQLPTLRKNTLGGGEKIDDAVSDVIRPPSKQPEPPKPADDKKPGQKPGAKR